MPANLENSAGDTGLEKVSFHCSPKEGQCNDCSNYCTVVLVSHASKVMLKILQARLQQYVKGELPDVQSGFRKGRRTRDQIVNLCWITEKAVEFQKNIYLCFTDHAKSFDCVDYNKLWKILQEMGIPDRLTCLLRSLYAGQEATMVRAGRGTLGRECATAVCYHPAYLTSVHSAVCFVAQLCPALCDCMDYSLPGSSVHGDSPGKKTREG